MNKNDKFHGAEFEVNAQAISDEELDAVSGGCDHCEDLVEYSLLVQCPYCNVEMEKKFLAAHKESCRLQKYASTTQCS